MYHAPPPRTVHLDHDLDHDKVHEQLLDLGHVDEPGMGMGVEGEHRPRTVHLDHDLDHDKVHDQLLDLGHVDEPGMGMGVEFPAVLQEAPRNLIIFVNTFLYNPYDPYTVPRYMP